MGVIGDGADFNGTIRIGDVARIKTEQAGHIPLPLGRGDFPDQNDFSDTQGTRIVAGIYDMVKDGGHCVQQVGLKSLNPFNMLFNRQLKGDRTLLQPQPFKDG
ncbi:hypothetical protein D3C73_1313490 [compost metagenome]